MPYDVLYFMALMINIWQHSGINDLKKNTFTFWKHSNKLRGQGYKRMKIIVSTAIIIFMLQLLRSGQHKDEKS